MHAVFIAAAIMVLGSVLPGMSDPIASGLSRETGPICVSGVYPHLTMWNEENECGTGAVVPWQDRLWAITYAPHRPGGSTDRLYEITPDLEQILFPGSVGGTPANRLIHRESNQLLIGPYLIDADRRIRVIPPSTMFGRLTGIARHLVDPRNRVYYATMEEGLYDVDVHTLDVRCLIRDGNPGAPEAGLPSQLPGYHGKGLYSTQGRLIYANNGERGQAVSVDPTVPSGALAEWFGSGDWRMIRRNQFTEVTGPGGIYGNPNPARDPVWTMGWDARSLILGLLEEGRWHFYRLPKGSHSYDGSHGWNTEWPRIREVGETDLLATMHGTFWRFPVSFSKDNSAGLSPRSNYLKVIGDFCRWNDRIVFGCDDSARAEFLNTRSFKAERGAPKQSNSNLWFVEPAMLDELGPALGRGSVWLRDDTSAAQVSDPYLFGGYDDRQLHLSHRSEHAVTFLLETDRDGTGQWIPLREIVVPPGNAISHLFEPSETGAWVRLTSRQEAVSVTASFHFRNRDLRDANNAGIFNGLVAAGKPARTVGLMRSLAHDRLGLVAAAGLDGEGATYYELNPKMELIPVDNPTAIRELIADVRQPARAYSVDAASVLIVEDGRSYRLPRSDLYSHAGSDATPEHRGTLLERLPGNLAFAASVSVSGTHENYVGANAVDGILTDESRWIGPRNQARTWIELDLVTAKTFRSIWVVTGWRNRVEYVAGAFDIEVKVGEEWRVLPGGRIRDNHQMEREVVLDEPVTARHVRVVSRSTDHFRVYEIALFPESPKLDTSIVAGFGVARVCREVATERDLLNVHGTFYELPARNAQGLAKIRPIATHDLAIHDFCSHNGLLFFTGIGGDTNSQHIFRSADGKAAVWAGVVDDLWNLGKPRGRGGPWMDTRVRAGVPSDPYLMTGYDRKTVELTVADDAAVTLQVDVDGTGLWIPYRTFKLKGGTSTTHRFPDGFSAYWVRAVSGTDSTASVQFDYF